jgi:hypothetical protein
MTASSEEIARDPRLQELPSAFYDAELEIRPVKEVDEFSKEKAKEIETFELSLSLGVSSSQGKRHAIEKEYDSDWNLKG